MLYFMVGDGAPLQLKYQELIHKIEKDYPSIPKNYYDFSQGENENFLARVSQSSIFESREIFIVKRFETLKGIDKFLKTIEAIDFSSKEIIFLYEEFFDEFGRREDEKDKAAQDKKKKLLELFKTSGEVSLSRGENLKKMGIHYVMDTLKITEKESEELLGLIGDDYFIIKNEVDKISSFLNGETYSKDKIRGLITVSKEYSMRQGIEEMLLEKKIDHILDRILKEKEYMQFIYILFEELLMYYKLNILEKENKIKYSMSYDEFKNRYEGIQDLFLNDKTGRPQHMYAVYLKLKNAKKFTPEFLLEKIKGISDVDYKIKSGEIDPDVVVPMYIQSFYN